MKSELKRRNIVAKKSPIHGYGVFAREDIPAKVVIEECFILYFSKNELILNDYLVSWTEDMGVLPLGYGVLYNHSPEPNAVFFIDRVENLIIVRSLRPIKRKEEILVSYGDKWFQTRNMKPFVPFKYKLRKWMPFLTFLLRFSIATIALYALIWWIKHR